MVGAGAGARRYSGTETDTSVDQSEDYMVLQVRAVLLCKSSVLFPLPLFKWKMPTFNY